ncbi:DNA photolyase family protein [Alphaproteobacteria bacterium]|nr:DNA photolyase family protein [Alphaproteobacteria bacterium]
MRRDLRVLDNPSLAYLESNNLPALAVYILDDVEKKSLGKASFWWLQKSLEKLRSEYKKRFGLDIIVCEGDALQALESLIKKYSIKEVIWNRLYSKQTIPRDSLIKKKLELQDIIVSSFNSHLLNEPWEIKNNSGEFFKVFTPYWRKSYPFFLEKNYSYPNIKKIVLIKHKEKIENFNFLPNKKWYKKFEQYWIPGENCALQKIDEYIIENINTYKVNRDRPDINQTSRISPHLKFGEISPRVIVDKIKKNKVSNESISTYLSEIGWREFAYTLLYYSEDLKYKPINKKFEKFNWVKNNIQLKSWKKGQTGFPIVDAAMLQLYEEGWMHNRLRMIVGSFLVKNLRIHWREGENYFQDCLLDYDEASNPAGWQWVSGCGADAAPYFRIFNPILQSERFDPEAKFILKYIPQLKVLEKIKFIFQPWLNQPVLKQLIKSKKYESPIVDLSISRNKALEAFKEVNQKI